MTNDLYVIGVDYGTDSVRSILVNALTGAELSTSVFNYPRWAQRKYCNASEQQYRQHPLDYIEGLEHTIKECISKAGGDAGKKVKGIAVDTTGSSPVAVDREGTPLSLLPQFNDEPDAMFILWKDHTAIHEAEEINAHAKDFETDYLQYVGGIYSSEWYWAKLLHIFRKNDAVRKACYSFVEHCDWIPFLLTGGKDASLLKRGRCSAGHKGLWSEDFGGFPPEQFFSSLDPLLKNFRDHLPQETYTSDQSAGTISSEWAGRLGLNDDVVIGIGAFDAHMGAVGGQIEPYHLSKVMGTSTCDILVVPANEANGTLVKGICGQVDGSVIPGMIGMEAGQSAFGDFYAWFNNVLMWPLKNFPALSIDEKQISEYQQQLLRELGKQAAALSIEDSEIIVTDWINGRRTPGADQSLKATISGLDLSSDAVKIFRGIVEGTCFGARAITDCFKEQGIAIEGLIGLGGIANKSSFIMQMLADVINLPIRIHKSEQTCALGAAMFAATAAGIYESVEEAMKRMGQGFSATYYPDAGRNELYNRKYEKYKKLGAVTSKINEQEHHFA